VLFSVGASALIGAYMDATTQIPFVWRNGSGIGLFLTVLPEVFLLFWAVILIGMSVLDLRRFIRSLTERLA
jgi:hypothetical protein